jgi:hypothetical protein
MTIDVTTEILQAIRKDIREMRESFEGRMDALEGRMDGLEGRMGVMEFALRGMATEMQAMGGLLRGVVHNVRDHGRRLDELEKDR